MNTTIYLCEDTVEGIFTAIYKAWEDGTGHTDVRIFGEFSLSFFEDYIEVSPDAQLARKVSSAIITKLSFDVYLHVYYACICEDPQKASFIYRFLQKAFAVGSGILNLLQDEDVNRIHKIKLSVGNEAGHYREFVRFEELENGVLIARVCPQHNIVLLIADYFADRMHNEHWIILDTKRSISAVHTAHQGYALTGEITEKKLLAFSAFSKKEAEFQALWKRFFDTIAIEERINPKLQQSLMPLRFRRYMNAESAPRDLSYSNPNSSASSSFVR